MGNNPTQALGVLAFLGGFTMIGVGLYSGGGVLLLLVGLALLGLSVTVFLKAKPWEHQE